MTSKTILGEDRRWYIVTSDNDMADKVTKISEEHIYIDSDIYESDKANLCVKSVNPAPLIDVPMKDILLIKESK